jgi:hypothetical protein
MIRDLRTKISVQVLMDVVPRFLRDPSWRSLGLDDIATQGREIRRK